MLSILKNLHKKEQLNDFEHRAIVTFFKKEIDILEDIRFYRRNSDFLGCGVRFKINGNVFYVDSNLHLSDKGIDSLIEVLNEGIEKIVKQVESDRVNTKHYEQQGLSKMAFYNKMGNYIAVVGLKELGLRPRETTSVQKMCDFISGMDMEDEELYPNKMFS